MGLSSSQARLLNLTTRMHQIEYKAAKLEAEKLQMANESSRAYEDYLFALETTKIQTKILKSDGSVSYKDIQSYQDFIDAGFAIQFNNKVYHGLGTAYTLKDDPSVLVGSSNRIFVSQYQIDNNLCPGADEEGFYYESLDGNMYYSQDKVSTVSKVSLDYAKLCHDAFGADIANPPTNVSEVITNLINSGDVTIVQKRADGTFPTIDDTDFGDYETSVAINTGLREVNNESLLRKAEAEYESSMKKIDMKDRKYDQDLAALDAERNAIKSEIETLKSVAKENVDRTFKLFS